MLAMGGGFVEPGQQVKDRFVFTICFPYFQISVFLICIILHVLDNESQIAWGLLQEVRNKESLHVT